MGVHVAACGARGHHQAGGAGHARHLHRFSNPALLAKITDTIEEISDGRLILGVGAGWNEAEFQAFGYPFDHRVSRFEEALQILHGLLREGQITFDGAYYEARDCVLRPRGPRPGGPPIMIGSLAPRMLSLLARYSDAWNIWWTNTGNTAAGVAPYARLVDDACLAIGRDPAEIMKTATTLVAVGPERAGPCRGHAVGRDTCGDCCWATRLRGCGCVSRPGAVAAKRARLVGALWGGAGGTGSRLARKTALPGGGAVAQARPGVLDSGGTVLTGVTALDEAVSQFHERRLAAAAQLADAKEPGDEDDCQNDDDEFLPTKTEHGESFSQ